MENVYSSPKSDVTAESTENNSGMKEDVYPEGVKGWSWGAFFFNWIWAIFNKSYIGLLAFLPYIGFIFAFYLGFKGRELAWKNKHWESVDHFNRVQKKWSIWAGVFMLIVLIGLVAAVAIPAYQEYMIRANNI